MAELGTLPRLPCRREISRECLCRVIIPRTPSSVRLILISKMLTFEKTIVVLELIKYGVPVGRRGDGTTPHRVSILPVCWVSFARNCCLILTLINVPAVPVGAQAAGCVSRQVPSRSPFPDACSPAHLVLHGQPCLQVHHVTLAETKCIILSSGAPPHSTMDFSLLYRNGYCAKGGKLITEAEEGEIWTEERYS